MGDRPVRTGPDDSSASATTTERTISAFVVSTPANLTYLVRVSRVGRSPARYRRDRTLLIVDGRYVGAARQMVEAADLGPVRVQPVTARYDLTLAEALGTVAGGRVGFEADEVTVAGWQRWQAAVPAVAWVPASVSSPASRY